MKNDSGKPETGRGSNRLGVRIPPDPNCDIEPNLGGHVEPGQGGMSVSSRIAFLKSFHIPKRLKDTCGDEFKRQFRNAVGNNSLTIWGHGSAFVEEDVAAGLTLRLDPNNPGEHGYVEPKAAVHIEDYERALYRTQVSWGDRESETK